VESRKGQELLALLRKHGEMARRELEDELGWPQRTVNTYLGWLLEARVVEKRGETNRKARYRALP
jgi:DNA-binding IclR family transcriptional regulator